MNEQTIRNIKIPEGYNHRVEASVGHGYYLHFRVLARDGREDMAVRNFIEGILLLLLIEIWG